VFINIVLLYTDCQSGGTSTIVRHVSFAQITCIIRAGNFIRIHFNAATRAENC